jgi:acetolactate synthase-1/2/3 large subunit
MEEEMTGAKAIVETLKVEGVKYIFGLPGTGLIPILDIISQTPSIQYIGTRHEQIAVHMADGYSRLSRELGVVLVTRGVGAANVVLGVMGAYSASSPILIICGQTPTQLLGRESFEEFDLVAMFKPVTKYSYQVERVDKIPEVLRRAIKVALQDRPGPVFVSIPEDLLKEKATFKIYPSERYRISSKVYPDPEEIEKAANLLINAENPVILTGSGVNISNASEELKELAELLAIPVTPIFGQYDILPTEHPLLFFTRKRELLKNADVVLAVGTRLTGFPTERMPLISDASKLIHIDIDGSQIAKIYPTDVGIAADAKASLRELIKRVRSKITQEKSEIIRDRFEKLKKTKKDFMEKRVSKNWDQVPITPYRLLKDLRGMLRKDTIIVNDSPTIGVWMRRAFAIYQPNTLFPQKGGCMGFGFPAALGAKLAKPEKDVVCIVGDGSFMMVLSALDTMVNYNIPILLVINNNSSYLNIKGFQKPPYFATDLKNPDFAKIAELFGAYAERVEQPSEIKPAISRSLAKIKEGKPSVLDVITTNDPKFAYVRD